LNLISLNDVDDDVLIPSLPPWDQMKILYKQKTKVIERLHSKLTGKKGRSKATWWCKQTKYAGQTDVMLVDVTRGRRVYAVMQLRVDPMTWCVDGNRLTNQVSRLTSTSWLTNHVMPLMIDRSRLTNHVKESPMNPVIQLTNQRASIYSSLISSTASPGLVLRV